MHKIFDVESLHELSIMDSFLKKPIKMALLQNGPSVDENENNCALDMLPSSQESSQPSPGSPQKFPLHHTLFPYRKITTRI